MSPKEAKDAAEKIKRFLERDAIDILGIEGKEHFKESFQNEGFTDKALVKWPDIKESTKKRKQRQNESSPKILTNEGHLGDSVDYNSDYGKGAAVFGSDLPYAQVHNEGGKVKKPARSELFKRNRKNNRFAPGTTAGRGFTFKESSSDMPKRQFIGASEVLEKKVVDQIEDYLDSIFN